MAHIKKMNDKPRTLPFRAQIKRQGHPTLVKMFQTRSQAERWAREQEKSILESGLPLTIDDLKRHTVSQIVRRYLEDITPHKGCHVSEAATLNAFLRRDIAKKSLAYLKKKDAYDYIASRQKEEWRGKKISNATIRRDINSISNIFVVAREQWGFENLTNPFREIKLKGSDNPRKRRLREGELANLEKASQRCLGLNKIYVPLAIYLAIETGMRQQEIFNLTWQDIDLEKRRIEIRKSKIDHVSKYKGRQIVLPVIAMFYLSRLLVLVGTLEPQHYSADAPIFPMTKAAFKQSWADVRKRAKIKDLKFHDLRHEAASRLDEAGLTKAEHDLMMGHKNSDMTSRYIHAELKTIQDKLDRHLLNGKTLDEVENENDPDKCIEGLADCVKGKHGEQLQKLFAQDLPFLPELREKIMQALAQRAQTEANVVPFVKAKAG